MPSQKAHDEVNRQTVLALLGSLWKSIKDHLENEKQRIYEEIKRYPTPIPACDAQSEIRDQRSDFYSIMSNASPRRETERLHAGGVSDSRWSERSEDHRITSKNDAR